jgi:hypothetical protein
MNLRVLILVFTLSGICKADPPSGLLRIPAGEDKMTPLRQGEPAPYSGVLMDPDTSKRWSGYLQQAEAIRSAEREAYERLLQIELKHVREVLQLQLSVKDRQIDIRERQIDQQGQVVRELEKKVSEGPPFYKTFWFGGLTGAVLVLGAGLVGAYVAR